MKRQYSVLIGLVLILLGGCSTPGNLKTDMEKLDLVFSGKQKPSSIDIEFTIPPGVVTVSTEMFASGVFIRGGTSLDTTPIALEMAEAVFSKSFRHLEFVDSDLEQKDDNYLIKLQPESASSATDGSHTAYVKAEFYNLDKSLLLETTVKHVVTYIQYAQKMPMQRAYLRAYSDIALQIHEKLLGVTGPAGQEKTDLLSTARPLVKPRSYRTRNRPKKQNQE